jgi:hypothetical protein
MYCTHNVSSRSFFLALLRFCRKPCFPVHPSLPPCLPSIARLTHQQIQTRKQASPKLFVPPSLPPQPYWLAAAALILEPRKGLSIEHQRKKNQVRAGTKEQRKEEHTLYGYVSRSHSHLSLSSLYPAAKPHMLSQEHVNAVYISLVHRVANRRLIVNFKKDDKKKKRTRSFLSFPRCHFER